MEKWQAEHTVTSQPGQPGISLGVFGGLSINNNDQYYTTIRIILTECILLMDVFHKLLDCIQLDNLI